MNHAPTFRFRGVRLDGTVEKGVVEAPDRESALAVVATRGVFPIDVSERVRLLPRRRASTSELAHGLRALATLMASGLPVSRALTILEDIVPPVWETAIPILRRRIDEGARLADAFETIQLGLPAHALGMIRAGEAAGNAAAATTSAADLLENRAADASALRNALSYPLLLAVAGGASVLLLVSVVLPRFVGILDDLGGTLPPLTRAVLGVGAFVEAAFMPGAILAVASMIAVRRWVSTEPGRRTWDRLLLRLPVVGPVRRGYAAGNVCATLSGLLRSGLPLSAALPLSAQAGGNAAIGVALGAVTERLHRGESFSNALRAESALTPTVVRFVRVGEESASLWTMLDHAGRVEMEQSLQSLRRAIRLIEPLMILVFGGIVMIVAASLLQAMYGIRPL